MTSHPEVAITIVTGGQHDATGEPGPPPLPLEQLPAQAAGATDTAGGPTPLDLDELAAQAAPRRQSPAKKTTAKKAAAKKSTAKRGGR